MAPHWLHGQRSALASSLLDVSTYRTNVNGITTDTTVGIWALYARGQEGYVGHTLIALFLGNVLSMQTLFKDKNHLTSQVSDQKRH